MSDSLKPEPSDEIPDVGQPEHSAADTGVPAVQSVGDRASEFAERLDDRLQLPESELVKSVETGLAGFFNWFEGLVAAIFGANTDAGPAKAEHDEPAAIGDETPLAERQPNPDALTYDDVLKPIRWKWMLGFGFTLVLIGAVYFGATLLQVRAAADEDVRDPADIIVVFGAAQFNGTPSPVLAARLDHAFDLYEDGVSDLIATTGSKAEGDAFTEGFSGYVYLRDLGVPDSDIVTVVDGENTWQQMSASATQMQERDLTTALLVSDGYHSFRLQAIADELGVQAWVSPTSTDATMGNYIRESTAVSLGRLIGYRRVSAASTSD